MAFFLLFNILLSTLLGAMPTSGSGDGWYVRRNDAHRQPELDPSFSYVEKYDAYYVDKGAEERGDRVIYLTFDAGYENGNVSKILDTLKAEGVSGAFFILDNLILRNEELVRRMRDEGHLVCNHTLRHRDMTKIRDKETFSRELGALADLYRERIGGEMAQYYRPPEGRFNEENLRMASELGYKTVFWSLAYADWDNANQPSREAAMKKILDNTHNGAVILLHPTSATNAAILHELIGAWRQEGYRFGTLDELTGRG